MAPGDTFEVPLEGTPTGGYVWELAPGESGQPVQFLDARFVLKPGGASGANATQVFRFRATGPGQATLHFRYGRPWDSQAAQERTIAVNVHSPD
ncbi:MAG: protease inhibitor I42 family protein [Candidatus Dormibacteraeota bacterium]|nr:protease inhibitor I42 family protein [Candidatus Dormibacteraeota bacterium]